MKEGDVEKGARRITISIMNMKEQDGDKLARRR